MNTFWQNLKGILVNSPLIVSAGPFFTSYIRPEFFDRFTPYWTQVLILIGALLTSRAANRAIDAKVGQPQQNSQEQDQK